MIAGPIPPVVSDSLVAGDFCEGRRAISPVPIGFAEAVGVVSPVAVERLAVTRIGPPLRRIGFTWPAAMKRAGCGRLRLSVTACSFVFRPLLVWLGIRLPSCSTDLSLCAGYQVCGINHDGLDFRSRCGEPRKDPCEHALLAPTLPAFAGRLVRTALLGRISRPQPIATDEDYARDDAKVVNAGLAVVLWELGFEARHLCVREA